MDSYKIHPVLQMAESMNVENMQELGEKEASEALIDLAQATEELAAKEKGSYSNTLKKWHSVSAAVAAVTLHNCYGNALQKYLAEVSTLSKETIEVLHRAGKLEKVLVQMVVEDTVECEDGGKSVVREMEPYEVDSIILRLLRKWIDDKLRKGKDCVQRARETEVSSVFICCDFNHVNLRTNYDCGYHFNCISDVESKV